MCTPVVPAGKCTGGGQFEGLFTKRSSSEWKLITAMRAPGCVFDQKRQGFCDGEFAVDGVQGLKGGWLILLFRAAPMLARTIASWLVVWMGLA